MRKISFLSRIKIIFCILRGGKQVMNSFVVIFATLVAENMWDYNEVPENLKLQVKELLILMGLEHLTN